MITAIYAHGVDGEFGNKDGTLPWGSIPAEIAALKLTLSNMDPDNIIIGRNTWITLPKSFQKFIIDLGVDLFIFGRMPVGDMTIGIDYYPLAKIGYTLPDRLTHESTVVLGGAVLLEIMYDHFFIDNAIVSIIGLPPECGSMSADTYLPKTILDRNDKATQIVLSTYSDELRWFNQVQYTYSNDIERTLVREETLIEPIY